MLKSLFSVVLPLVFTSSTVFAQTATLRGLITDESGAAVSGAKVTLTGNSQAPRTAVSSNDGSYSIVDVIPGSYTLQASAPDLAAPAAAVVLRMGVQTVNLQLKVASIAQQVTVEERAVAVTPETARNASATVIAGEDLNALSDNPDDLIAELIAIAGAGPGGVSLLIDGFSNGRLLSKDSIREIRINQNPFSPEYDRPATGRIEIITRPGTNQFRGSGTFNFAGDFWNSRNPYAQEKAPFLLKEYGANLSGPISKRSSFFFDARRDAVDNGAIINGTTLDPDTLRIVDPFTQVFRIPQRRWNLSPRADYQIGPNNTLTVRYGFSHVDIPYSGVGSFNLVSRGYRTTTAAHTLQASETAVLAENVVNEARFQFSHSGNETAANTPGPAIQVLGSFNGGGAQTGHSFDTQRNYEFQDYISVIHGRHTWRFGARLRHVSNENISPQNFGGTFTFGGGTAPVLDSTNQPVLDSAGRPVTAPITSIERYRRTVLFQRSGFSPSQIRSLGGGATQFSINAGDSRLAARQSDIGAFVGDDWRLRRNFALSFGIRYEGQTNIQDWRDFAPRIAMAWAPGEAGASSRSKTVVRSGFGIFYERFSLGNTLRALRYNGIRQQQYVVSNPDFFPSPSISSVAGSELPQIREQVSSDVVAPYISQFTAGIDRELPFNTVIAITYVNTGGWHMFRSRALNAPLPGTYNPDVPGAGVFPFGAPGAIFQMESSGRYNQNQLTLNVNSRANRNLSLNGSYTLNRAMSDTNGAGTFAANPYSSAGEYGPAAADVRHRATFGGTINMKWNIGLNPLVTLESGPPFNITVGRDIYGTTLFNGRPAIAADPNKPGVKQTVYGLLDPNPMPGQEILHRNYGRGPGSILANLRVSKTITFGPVSGRDSNSSGQGPARRPYNLSISLSIRNVLNHNNPGAIIGNIASPLFGRANQPAGGGGFGGFSESANNRRLELMTRITF